MLHQRLASAQPGNGHHYAILTLLRNTETPLGAVTQAISLSWVWRNRASRVVRRVLPVILLAILTLISFTLAASFTAYITSSADPNVLVEPESCGVIKSLGPESSTGIDENFVRYNTRQVAFTTAARTQAKRCSPGPNITQTSEQSLDSACNTYSATFIPYALYENVACPVEDSLCFKNETGRPIQFDTGFIDPTGVLGVNLRAYERLFVSRISTCAPINSTAHRQIFPGDDINSTTVLIDFGRGSTIRMLKLRLTL